MLRKLKENFMGLMLDKIVSHRRNYVRRVDQEADNHNFQEERICSKNI